MAVRTTVSVSEILLTVDRVSKLPFVQSFLWSNAGFDGLRKLDDLNRYTERWDVSCSSHSNIPI